MIIRCAKRAEAPVMFMCMQINHHKQRNSPAKKKMIEYAPANLSSVTLFVEAAYWGCFVSHGSVLLHWRIVNGCAKRWWEDICPYFQLILLFNFNLPRYYICAKITSFEKTFGPKYTGYVYIQYENTQNLTLPNVYLPVLKRVKWCFCVLLANSSLRLKRFFLKVN